MQAVHHQEKSLHWYGVRIFYNRVARFVSILEDRSVRYFLPMHTVEKRIGEKIVAVREPLVGSLIFVQSTEGELRELLSKFGSGIAVYTDPTDKHPAEIPAAQMETFMQLCSLTDSGLEYLGEDAPEYHCGDRVRVTQGLFKGLEGHIKRIRHDRRLIVTVEGIAAFATGFISPADLEKMTDVRS